MTEVTAEIDPKDFKYIHVDFTEYPHIFSSNRIDVLGVDYIFYANEKETKRKMFQTFIKATKKVIENNPRGMALYNELEKIINDENNSLAAIENSSIYRKYERFFHNATSLWVAKKPILILDATKTIIIDNQAIDSGNLSLSSYNLPSTLEKSKTGDIAYIITPPVNCHFTMNEPSPNYARMVFKLYFVHESVAKQPNFKDIHAAVIQQSSLHHFVNNKPYATIIEGEKTVLKPIMPENMKFIVLDLTDHVNVIKNHHKSILDPQNIYVSKSDKIEKSVTLHAELRNKYDDALAQIFQHNPIMQNKYLQLKEARIQYSHQPNQLLKSPEYAAFASFGFAAMGRDVSFSIPLNFDATDSVVMNKTTYSSGSLSWKKNSYKVLLSQSKTGDVIYSCSSAINIHHGLNQPPEYVYLVSKYYFAHESATKQPNFKEIHAAVVKQSSLHHLDSNKPYANLIEGNK